MMHYDYHGHVNEKVLKQVPHVIASIYLFHFHLCVDIAVI